MYLIPKNVGGRFEFMEGFGIKELIYCAIGTLIGLGLTYVLGIFTEKVWRYIPVPMFAYITFLAVRVDPRLGKSILDNFNDMKSFNSKPKRYDYVYGEGRNKK
jgi:hypothetical protein